MDSLQKYDKIRLIRRNMSNNDPIEIEEFAHAETDIIMKTNFASSTELEEFLKEFDGRVFFSGDGLAIYG